MCACFMLKQPVSILRPCAIEKQLSIVVNLLSAQPSEVI